jgi:hypothetical protein
MMIHNNNNNLMELPAYLLEARFLLRLKLGLFPLLNQPALSPHIGLDDDS